ncbi:MAG: transposase [Isosphaeraceae bacterium]
MIRLHALYVGDRAKCTIEAIGGISGNFWALLDQAKAWGVRWACVTADADYGDTRNFLEGLEKRHERYVVAVRCDFAVALSRRGGEAQRADAVIGSQPPRSWRTVAWREGSQGWLRDHFVAVRAWRVNSSGRRKVGWLIGEDASDGKRQYYWSNFGPEVALEPMVEYAHRRHWVEQYHEEAKGLLGWDQYQGRLWPGFHRHAVSVMLAYSFLVWQEWQQRQEQTSPGRPRRAFPPSAGVAIRDTVLNWWRHSNDSGLCRTPPDARAVDLEIRRTRRSHSRGRIATGNVFRYASLRICSMDVDLAVDGLVESRVIGQLFPSVGDLPGRHRSLP